MYGQTHVGMGTGSEVYEYGWVHERHEGYG